ncbi:unnamed protein product, partial [Staurois parvus]
WGPPAIRDHGAPVSLPKLKKAYEKVNAPFLGMYLSAPCQWDESYSVVPSHKYLFWGHTQGWTGNSWGPRAIGDHGAPVSSPTLKPNPKQPMRGSRGISWGPLLTPALGQRPIAAMVSPPLGIPQCIMLMDV